MRFLERYRQLERRIEALMTIIENYVPADKIDEANNELIRLLGGQEEQIGRDLLNSIPPAHLKGE